MSVGGEWVVLAGCSLVVASAGALGYGVVHSGWVRARVRAQLRHLDGDLRYLQLRVEARALGLVQLGLVGFALLAGTASGCAAWLALAGLSWFGPGLWLRGARRRRTARIEQQLDGFLLALANALRANPALGSAIAASAELLAPPLSSELGVALRERELGVPLDRALRHVAERTGSPVVRAALAIVSIARTSGGDLSQTLETAAASLREMARLEGVVRTKTAEGRAQTVVIAAAPPLLVMLLEALDPGLLDPLWTAATGHAVVAAALCLWAAALVLARKIVAVDV